MSFTAESQIEDDCFIRFFNSFINGMKAKLLPVQIKGRVARAKKKKRQKNGQRAGVPLVS